MLCSPKCKLMGITNYNPFSRQESKGIFSTTSIELSDNHGKKKIYEELTDDIDQEMQDLTDKTLANLELENCAEMVAKRTKPKAFTVLYIQSGQKYRAPITKKDFEAFLEKAKLKIGELVLSRKWDQT